MKLMMSWIKRILGRKNREISWAKKQIREMVKLGGRLIVM